MWCCGSDCLAGSYSVGTGKDGLHGSEIHGIKSPIQTLIPGVGQLVSFTLFLNSVQTLSVHMTN